VGKPDICLLLACREKSQLKTSAGKKEDNISDIKYTVESILNFGVYNCATVLKEFWGLTIDTTSTWNHHIGELTSRLNKACYAIRSIKAFMSLHALRSTHFPYAHSIIFYGIIFLGNSSYSEDIFKIRKRIIMNSSKNAFCWQLFKDLNILPIQSQYIYIQYFYLLLKIKTNFCLPHKYIKSIKGKLLICTYLQQILLYTKRVSTTQELRFTIIYQQPLKIYVVIGINSS